MEIPVFVLVNSTNDPSKHIYAPIIGIKFSLYAEPAKNTAYPHSPDRISLVDVFRKDTEFRARCIAQCTQEIASAVRSARKPPVAVIVRCEEGIELSDGELLARGIPGATVIEDYEVECRVVPKGETDLTGMAKAFSAHNPRAWFTDKTPGEEQSLYHMQNAYAPLYGRLGAILNSINPTPLGATKGQAEVVRDLRLNGIVRIAGAFPAHVVETWRQSAEALTTVVMKATAGKQAPSVESLFEGGLTVIRHSEHRLDMWPVDPIITDLAPGPKNLLTKTIGVLLEACTTSSIVHKTTGLLPLMPSPEDVGTWHRDAETLDDGANGNIREDDANAVCHGMPNHYFTVFIPLSRVDATNGATKVIPGSHHCSILSIIDKGSTNHVQSACAEPGDVIIMNGRTLHCGTPNTSDAPRLMAYAIFCARWFEQELR